jgi:hypothetical protein
MVGVGKKPEDHQFESMLRAKEFTVLYCFSDGFPGECGTESVVANPLFGWHFWQYHLNNAHSRISELKRIQRKALRQSSSSSILIMIKQKHLYVDSLISEPIGLVIIAVMLLIYTTHLEKEFKKDQM